MFLTTNHLYAVLMLGLFVLTGCASEREKNPFADATNSIYKTQCWEQRVVVYRAQTAWLADKTSNPSLIPFVDKALADLDKAYTERNDLRIAQSYSALLSSMGQALVAVAIDQGIEVKNAGDPLSAFAVLVPRLGDLGFNVLEARAAASEITCPGV